MSRLTHAPEERVAAIVYRIKGHELVIETHVPAQSRGLEDDSLTTTTGPFARNPHHHPPFSDQLVMAMRKTVCEQLGVRDNKITDCQVLLGTPQVHGGKRYYWLLVGLKPEAVIHPDRSKIQSMVWNNPHQLVTSVARMSDSRRKMFAQALEVACCQNLFGVNFPFKVLGQLKPQAMALA